MRSALAVLGLQLHLLLPVSSSEDTRRWAVVTGASAGIGAASASLVAEKGFHVLIAARRKQRLEELAARIREESPDVAVRCVPCDLARAEGIEALCAAAAECDVGLVVLNAGICEPAPLFSEQRAESVSAMLDLNVRATTTLLGRFSSSLSQQPLGGKLLVIASSAAAPPGVPGVAVYAASKAYLRSLVAATRAELKAARTGVSVTCALPSAVDTEFSSRSGLGTAAIFSLPGVRKIGGIVLPAHAVATSAVNAALRGRSEVVPGLMPRLYVGLTDCGLLPGPISRAVAAFSFAPLQPSSWPALARWRPARGPKLTKATGPS